jgi:hypothetical protein
MKLIYVVENISKFVYKKIYSVWCFIGLLRRSFLPLFLKMQFLVTPHMYVYIIEFKNFPQVVKCKKSISFGTAEAATYEFYDEIEEM